MLCPSAAFAGGWLFGWEVGWGWAVAGSLVQLLLEEGPYRLPFMLGNGWMCCAGLWLARGPGSARLMAEFNDLRGLFQH